MADLLFKATPQRTIVREKTLARKETISHQDDQLEYLFPRLRSLQ